jgi:uncharacterized membrane protein
MGNLACPNNWEIKKCLRLSLGILLAALGLIGLAALGFDIPILRQIVGFIFLTFVPGLLILRILKIRNVGVIESLLYSVGLSAAVVMGGMPALLGGSKMVYDNGAAQIWAP